MKTNLSRIVAGTMNWGIWGKNMPTIEMSAFIELCVEYKITSFDLADIYGDYTTESDFGKALHKCTLDRSAVQLVTKCGIQSVNGRNNPIKHYDYSKEYIIWSVENALKNMQTDYVDVLLLHRPSPLMVPDEIAEAVDKLKQDGKIIDFGVSNFTASQTELIRQKTEINYNQIQFSATHFQAMLDGSLDYMYLHKIRTMAWNPLGSVFKEDVAQTRRLKKLLAELGEKYNLSADAILLAWVLKHPTLIIPVIGTTIGARIKIMEQVLDLKLDPLDWFAIWTESMGRRVD